MTIIETGKRDLNMQPQHLTDQEDKLPPYNPKDSSVNKNPASDKDKNPGNGDSDKPLSPHRTSKPFRPIIMSFVIMLIFGGTYLHAQIQGSVTIGTQFTDNVFALSDYDFTRFNQNHANLEFVNTTDDLSLMGRIDLNYPLRYRWWKIEPSITANLSNNVSNTDKYRRDFLGRVRIERYHWNATAMYGYYPYIYVRDYIDTDGTGKLEKYSYERNLYRVDANYRITRNTTLRAQARYENYYYNEFWTQFDGDAQTYGVGVRHSFPVFTINAMYYFRSFENDWDPSSGYNDSTYESDRYAVDISLKPMPLDDLKKLYPTWRPTLSLSYEDRFYQGEDSWYGGRIDRMYNTRAGIHLFLSDEWNISLDYSHTFRSVDSPNASVLRLKEYAENRLAASVKYNF